MTTTSEPTSPPASDGSLVRATHQPSTASERLVRLVALWGERFRPISLLAERVLDRVRRHPVAGELYEIFDGVVLDYGRDHGAMYAGALTFYGVLSLIPLTVLLASVFGFMLSATGGGDVDGALEQVVAQLRRVLPYLSPRFVDDLRTIVEYRSRLGVVGFAALLWAASEIFRGVEFASARIFASADGHVVPDHKKTAARAAIITKLLFGAVATAVVLTSFLLQMLTTMWRRFLMMLDLPPWLAAVVADPLREGSPLGFLVTAASIVIGFVVVVRVFSPHRIMTRFAVFGGVLFLAFFEGAHAVYDVYLEHITNISAMYGSFATLVILILWMYYCAVLLLVCFHAVKVAQRRLTVGPRWPKDGTLMLWWPPSRS